MSLESGYRLRLAELLAERNAPVEPLLNAIELGGASQVYLGFGALSNRVHLMLPRHPAVLHEVAPSQFLPERLQPRGVLRVECDGPSMAVGLVTMDAVPARDALEELDDEERAARWAPILEPLLSFANGLIMNRTRFLTETRAVISVAYQPRTGDAERAFLKGIDEHFARIGLANESIAMWNRLYPASGAGRLLSITTELGASGPSARTGVLNDNNTFDQAIDLIKVANAGDATPAAVRLGALSGALEINSILGSEILLANDRAADVMVWLPPKT